LRLGVVQVDQVLAVDEGQAGRAVAQVGGEFHGRCFRRRRNQGWGTKRTRFCASFKVGRAGEMPHWSTRPGGHFQSVGAARHVAVVDLLHFGRVLDDDAEGVDEIVEEVVAGAVAAGAPLDREAGVAHAAAAAHHRLVVRHQEGDVVQRVVVADADGERVVVAVAVHEGDRRCGRPA
jgi:hypothetical protein